MGKHKTHKPRGPPAAVTQGIRAANSAARAEAKAAKAKAAADASAGALLGALRVVRTAPASGTGGAQLLLFFFAGAAGTLTFFPCSPYFGRGAIFAA